MSTSLHIACLGGGHGLYQTLCAARVLEPASINAIVTVADDGGSSGRLRRELEIIPPGDLRMALAALSRDDEDGQLWARTLQHRFRGHGALAGHAVGNLLIAGLTELLGDEQAALDRVAQLTNSYGRVLPVVSQPLDIEAEVAGLDDDPRLIRSVRGQVAVATTPGQVRRVRLIPEAPPANPEALTAIERADMVTLGPGSWFSSVLPHVLVPEMVRTLTESAALTVVVLNLTAEPGETRDFSAERHLHVLAQHAPGLRVDRFVVDESVIQSPRDVDHLQRAASALGAQVVLGDVAEIKDGQPTNLHAPDKLARELNRIYREARG